MALDRALATALSIGYAVQSRSPALLGSSGRQGCPFDQEDPSGKHDCSLGQSGRTGISAERKTTASSQGTLIFLVACCALRSEMRALAFRLARSTGLSSEIVLPSGRSGPCSSVTPDPPWPTLALDEPEPLLGQDKKIDLVDRTVVGLKFKIRPCPVRIIIRQTLADEIQRTPFPLILRRRDDFPSWRFHTSSWLVAALLHSFLNHPRPVRVASPVGARHRGLPA